MGRLKLYCISLLDKDGNVNLLHYAARSDSEVEEMLDSNEHTLNSVGFERYTYFSLTETDNCFTIRLGGEDE
jgi:hypothetical protein